MGRINRLAADVADRIAAGEVVERPASVVRELVDNALDAGASRLEIDLEEGGRRLVAVADDGCGMDAEDARLAFERHATSKISAAEDLEAVVSLGFRGEALAAIAAVARVELLTRAAGGPAATRVVVDHGREVLVEPATRAPGTTIAVHELFSGVPARRKFLKSAATELDRCLRTVERAAVARPDVAIRVRHGGREALAFPATVDPGARAAAVLGPRWGRRLLAAEERAGVMCVLAHVAPAETNRPSSAGIRIMVNRRPVRDPLLLRAVIDAFRSVLPGGRYPVAVIDVELPPDAVDVNVHPAKSEVRFESPREVRALVVGTVRRALSGAEAAPTLVPRPAAGPPPEAAAQAGLPVREPAGPRYDAPGGGHREEPGARPGPGERPAPARALAQYADCFILAEDAEGLLIVDQHVAHERLLFETLARQADQGPLPRQALVFEAPLELSPEQMELFETHRRTLERLGFRAEPFGPGSVSVREVPAIYGRHARPETLADVLERLRAGDAAGSADLHRELLATLACHSAVRKGMRLPVEKMDYILGGLSACALPTHCPHGRVISLRVDLGPLSREFGR